MTETEPLPSPWWLEIGPETCTGCEITLHLEALVYCVQCDHPFCPICAVSVSRHEQYLCIDCEEAV